VDNYRRKDYFTPRSMREAYGHDETFEPNIRCISKSWAIKKRPAFPFVLALAAIVIVIWQIIELYGH